MWHRGSLLHEQPCAQLSDLDIGLSTLKKSHSLVRPRLFCIGRPFRIPTSQNSTASCPEQAIYGLPQKQLAATARLLHNFTEVNVDSMPGSPLPCSCHVICQQVLSISFNHGGRCSFFLSMFHECATVPAGEFLHRSLRQRAPCLGRGTCPGINAPAQLAQFGRLAPVNSGVNKCSN